MKTSDDPLHRQHAGDEPHQHRVAPFREIAVGRARQNGDLRLWSHSSDELGLNVCVRGGWVYG